MILLDSKFGPFGPVAGYCSSIMAAGGAIYLMWAGPMKKFRPPDKDMPGAARAFVLLMCGVYLVLGFYYASPENSRMLVGTLVATAVISLWFFLKYSSLLGTYGYRMPVPVKGGRPGQFEDTLILGGTTLLPEAEEKRKQFNVGIQELLEGAQYKVDRLWSREDQQKIRDKALRFFLGMLIFGTAALITGGYVMEVTVLNKEVATKKAALSVIHKE